MFKLSDLTNVGFIVKVILVGMVGVGFLVGLVVVLWLLGYDLGG